MRLRERWMILVLMAGALAKVPALHAQQSQHDQDMAQLQALQQQILSGTDPCAVLPKLKIVMTRISKESPEAYNAMKPALDLLNQDTDCPAAPATPVPPPPVPSPPPTAPESAKP